MEKISAFPRPAFQKSSLRLVSDPQANPLRFNGTSNIEDQLVLKKEAQLLKPFVDFFTTFQAQDPQQDLLLVKSGKTLRLAYRQSGPEQAGELKTLQYGIAPGNLLDIPMDYKMSVLSQESTNCPKELLADFFALTGELAAKRQKAYDEAKALYEAPRMEKLGYAVRNLKFPPAPDKSTLAITLGELDRYFTPGQKETLKPLILGLANHGVLDHWLPGKASRPVNYIGRHEPGQGRLTFTLTPVTVEGEPIPKYTPNEIAFFPTEQVGAPVLKELGYYPEK